MATALRTCVACGNGFAGRGRAVFCSAACRQRAYRSRKAGDRNAASVTKSGGHIDTVQTRDGVVAALPGVSTGRVHTAEALAVLAELDGELAENAEELGEQLAWSAAEKTVRELIADTIDRRGGLLQLYQGAENGALRVRLSAELRFVGDVAGSASEAGENRSAAAVVAALAEGAAGSAGAVGPCLDGCGRPRPR